MQELLRNLAHLMNYRKQVPAEGFTDLMGKILAGLPGLGWELGPALSDADIDLLSLSVMHAPALLDDEDFTAGFPLRGEGWIVDLGVPPRDWDIYFKASFGGKALEIEGREWAWTMSGQEGPVRLSLAVPPAQGDGLDAAALQELAEIIVVGELGERNVLRHVAAIEVLGATPAGGVLEPMAHLRARFAERFPDCAYAAWLSASRR
ncbi:hypothetical protein [Massilia sp. ST3]|uniref:hypothetical protein n=1 Tax=Massilia sp. ST3 TaxID=2824903 RepID=UPI001B8408D1|nr:hypothetical protein [Massilia sp. ST3]MBQ5948655.1 hypothetical protein [Massilia sp. ST3]